MTRDRPYCRACAGDWQACKLVRMLALFSDPSRDKRSRLSARPNQVLRFDGDDVIVATERVADRNGSYALDVVRQRKGEDPRALAEERDHEARAWAQLATPMVVTVPCAACGTPAARVEIVPPGQLPAGWDQWPATAPGQFVRRPDPGEWYVLRHGIGGDDSYGGPRSPSAPGRSPGPFALLYATPRCAPPDSTTTWDSAPTAKSPDRHRHWQTTDTGDGHYCP